jgi:hypothetical protein
MGIALDVFYLVRFAGSEGGCEHHLLVRASRRSNANANQADEDAASAEVERERDRLEEEYAATILRDTCDAAHTRTVVGEMQEAPVGDELYSDASRRRLRVWVAETAHGAPWVVLGTADSEESFWRELEDTDAAMLRPMRPARSVEAFFYPQPSPP